MAAASIRMEPTNSSRFSSAASDRKSTRLNSSHSQISYAVFCLKKKIICDEDERHDNGELLVRKGEASSSVAVSEQGGYLSGERAYCSVNSSATGHRVSCRAVME